MTDKQCENRSMGIGRLGDPNVTIGRKFRFTLKGDNLSESFVKSVKIDYYNKTIKLSYMDVLHKGEGFHGLVWTYRFAHKLMLGETLTLTTYDGCGTPLYEVRFLGLSIEGHTSEFDYELSEASTQEITIKFKDYGIHLPSCEPPGMESKWTISIKNGDQDLVSEAFVLISQRPSLDIEEIKVEFLNSETIMPGKARWEPLQILFAGHYGKLVELGHDLKQRFDITLTYKGEKFTEIWAIQDAWFTALESNELSTKANMVFSSVRYKEETS